LKTTSALFSPKTLRAAGLLPVAGVGSVVTARCGDAPTSPSWPQTKFLAAAFLGVFKKAPAFFNRGWTRMNTDGQEFLIFELRFLIETMKPESRMEQKDTCAELKREVAGYWRVGLWMGGLKKVCKIWRGGQISARKHTIPIYLTN